MCVCVCVCVSLRGASLDSISRAGCITAHTPEDIDLVVLDTGACEAHICVCDVCACVCVCV